MSRRVVVLGGGVTGLAAAYRLLEAARPGLRVVVLEPDARVGGNIRTDRLDGLVVDGGPDAFVAAKPDAKALCGDLGIGDRLIGTDPDHRKVYLGFRGRLEPMPEGLFLTVPTALSALARTPILSARAKVRLLAEVAVPRRPPTPEADESIADFVRRRLGPEVLERLADPILGGVYAGDVEALSIRSTFPQLVALEKKYGSLVIGARAELARRGHGPRAPSAFLAPRTGMGELPEALLAAIRDRGGDVRTGVAGRSLARGTEGNGRWRVGVDGGETLDADDVVLACPADAAAELLAPHDAALAAGLRGIPYVSTATVMLAYRRDDVPHPLDATGIVFDRGEGRRLLAATFASSKWEGRAPADRALLRVFFGGHRDPGALRADDAGLVELARAELGAVLGVPAHAEPTFARVYRFVRKSPQPTVGHAARVVDLRARADALGGLHLVGAAYDGIGIPDCVRQAGEAARRIVGKDTG